MFTLVLLRMDTSYVYDRNAVSREQMRNAGKAVGLLMYCHGRQFSLAIQQGK